MARPQVTLDSAQVHEGDARSALRIGPGRQVEGQSAGDRLLAYFDDIAEREREAGLIVHGTAGHLPEVG